jgi:hypothetical protein
MQKRSFYYLFARNIKLGSVKSNGCLGQVFTFNLGRFKHVWNRQHR